MTTTTYLELDDQATGANNNTWGDVADSNMAILEQAIARYVAIATTGGTTTLTSSQNRYPIIRLTGVLSSNATIEVKTQEKNWIFINATTGSYTVTVKTSAGTGKTLPRGRAVKLYCDGTNVEYARDRGIPAAQAGGTVDAITATFEPVTTSAELQDGTLWIVEAAGANTSTTPTFNPDSTGALTIKKNGGQALAAGDIRAAGHKLLLCYDSSGGHVELMNPMLTAASTTEVLTGTDTSRSVTPDALAALWEKGSDVASAGTTSLGEGGYFNITGTTTITDIDFATDKAGRKAWVKFAGALTLTHSATLILPTSANITTAAGDTACFVSEGSDTVRCVAYNRATGLPVGAVSSATTYSTGGASGNYTIPANASTLRVRLWGAGGGGAHFVSGISNAGGGGGGGYYEIIAPVATFGGAGASVAYSVGSGGTGGSGGTRNGTKGGNTTFGSYTAYGGEAGTGAGGSGAGFYGLTGYGAQTSVGTDAAQDFGGAAGGSGTAGGDAVFGGAGGGGYASSSAGGTSVFGGAGGAGNSGGSGTAGSAPGGGGGGGNGAGSGGAGGAGRIEVYAW